MKIIGVSGYMGSGKDTVADCFVGAGFVKISLADPMKRFVSKVFGFTTEQLWGFSDLRNEVDTSFYKDKNGLSSAWWEAHDSLLLYGEEWVSQLLPNADEDEIYAATEYLESWFNELSNTYSDALSPRVVLQTLGTEWGRNCVRLNLWIHQIVLCARELENPCAHYDKERGITYDRPRLGKLRGVIVSDIRFKNELDYLRTSGHTLIRVDRDVKDSALRTGIANHASEAEQSAFDPSLFDYIIDNSGTLPQLVSTVQYIVNSVTQGELNA